MEYRKLGRTGVKVSAVSLGSWLTLGNTVDAALTAALVRRAFELGINHLDTADVYAEGRAEEALGAALAGTPRKDYVLASKVFWPTGKGPNDRGLSRKHIREALDASLRRLRTEYLDVYYAHRFDPEVPLEETLRAMEDAVRAGKTLYWGTSCWSRPQIEKATKNAHRYAPSVEQPRYNVFDRHVERDILPFCAKEGVGIAIWSPLAEGVLSGKYLKGRPAGSRAADDRSNYFIRTYLTPAIAEVVEKLVALAAGAGLTPAQLALGWCLSRPEINTVLVGATRAEQLEENAAARPLAKELLAQVQAAIEKAPQVGVPG
ncbi:MAG: aldo/keto reductase family protein [Planctomycetes bacterium]|nr:aldo/keto reductase family protein [Planctomycetota bacterium]